ncbi:MAG TPA: STAS domain-containing protein [Pseudonocardiaceae bacterium]|jgi:anti-anti-sigma factor|nr:STAS domain-containing protein [Pseudonocardiaceae bacterium]
MSGGDLSPAGQLLRTDCSESAAAVWFTVWGEVDVATSGTLARRLREAVALASPSRPLTVDLRDVTFLGAAGLRVLVDTQAACDAEGIRTVVVADQSAVLTPLTVSGVAGLLTVVPG